MFIKFKNFSQDKISFFPYLVNSWIHSILKSYKFKYKFWFERDIQKKNNGQNVRTKCEF